MKTKLWRVLSNPYMVMALVVAMYIVKASVKITIGNQIHSPMIAGDGFHNIADILEALAVILVIFVAKLPASREYPFGRKNIEFFTSLGIGGALLVLCLQFAATSVAGLLALQPALDAAVRSWLPLPHHEPLVMDAATFPWVLAVTAGSVVLSVLVSRYQILIGKKAGHASLVADGEETASDGRIEAVTLIGVLAEYVLHAPWLEYPLGLFVAFLIGHTGYKLFISAWRVLLQHSIGDEHEQQVRALCLKVPGVRDIQCLKTFQVGQTAVVMVTVVTAHNAETTAHIKFGIEYAWQRYLEAAGFNECEPHIKFQKPDPERHRICYAIVRQANCAAIADSLAVATDLLVCDVERGAVVRSRLSAKPEAVGPFLVDKRVRTVFTFGGQDELADGQSMSVQQSPAYLQELLGLV